MFSRNAILVRTLNKRSLGDRKYLSSVVDYRKPYPTEAGHVRKSPYTDVVVPNVTIDKYVWSNFSRWETKVAAVCGVTDRSYTFAQLRDNCAALAVRLQTKFKLQRNDVVAVCLPNVPEFPIVTLGTVEAGCIVTSVNPTYTPEEISRQLIGSDAKMIITSCAQFQTVQAAVSLAKKNISIVTIRTESPDEKIPEGAVNFAELISPQGLDFSALTKYDTSVHDICFLPYSSGTTGLAKGVQLTNLNLIANSEMLQTEMNGSRLILPTTETYQDVLPCILPFFHIYGFTCTLLSKLHLGCQLVTLPRFLPETFLGAMAKYKGTMVHLVPPIVIFLGHHDKVEKKHMESIRIVMSGAAPMGAPDAERFIARAPKVKFIQGYGLTETSPVVMFGEQGVTNYTSVGKPLSATEAKIVALDDATNTGLGPREVGELLVRGPQIMKGYLNNEKATKEMIIENGWLRTGDLAYYDEEDNFYITDRLKELIKVKGFQVPPAELEEILRSHPKVLDAGVVGVPHPISGEVPRAFVVAKEKGGVTENELKDFVAQKVAKYKRLEGGVVFLEAIPKNASGKILRREIKAKYC